MSVEGIILHHGEAGGVTLHQTRVDYLLTAERSKQCSLFEFTIAPGFNTGAHYHTRSRSCSTCSRTGSALWRAGCARRNRNLRVCASWCGPRLR